MSVSPYLFFDGHCEEALAFYQATLNAQIEAMMRFSENPDPCNTAPGTENKIMHASFRVGDTLIMASDGNCGGQKLFAGFSLTIETNTPEEAQRLFTALGESGQVQMPMTPTFFSPMFGMLADKFGMSWMVMAKVV